MGCSYRLARGGNRPKMRLFHPKALQRGGWAGLGCRGSSSRLPVPVAVASDLSALS